jgi:hypothetical protein
MDMQPLEIECWCGVVVKVPVTAEISSVHPVDRQDLNLKPDLTDLWAHSFTHGGGPKGGLPIAS